MQCKASGYVGVVERKELNTKWEKLNRFLKATRTSCCYCTIKILSKRKFIFYPSAIGKEFNLVTSYLN